MLYFNIPSNPFIFSFPCFLVISQSLGIYPSFCFLLNFIRLPAGTASPLFERFSITIIISLRVFHTSVSWWFFFGIRVTARLLQISQTLLNILADLNNAHAWIVSSWPLIFLSSSFFTNPLRIVPSVRIIP